MTGSANFISRGGVRPAPKCVATTTLVGASLQRRESGLCCFLHSSREQVDHAGVPVEGGGYVDNSKKK